MIAKIQAKAANKANTTTTQQIPSTQPSLSHQQKPDTDDANEGFDSTLPPPQGFE